MQRVTGIGGIFFKAKDPKALGAWYKTHLGIDVSDWGGCTFDWAEPGAPQRPGQTVWSLFPDDTTYFSPGTAPFMINYRVADLESLVAQLRVEGCAVDEKGIQDNEYGKFAWVLDPEGNRLELWQPPPGGCAP
jgi:predicted enzyme related to lactoylglutathione lyase